MAHFVSVQNGSFTDGATWGNTSPGLKGFDFPGAGGDTFNIAAGHEVIYAAEETNQLGASDVYGTLKVSREVNTLISFGTGYLTVRIAGVLDWGTEEDPIPASVTAKFEMLAGSTSSGINHVLGAQTFFHGDPAYYGNVRETYLLEDWTSGQSFKVAGDVTGWQQFQEVLVHKGSYKDRFTDIVLLTIDEVVADGADSIVTILNAFPGGVFLAGGEVFNLSRNVEFGKLGNTRALNNYGGTSAPFCANTQPIQYAKHVSFINARTLNALATESCVVRNASAPMVSTGSLALAGGADHKNLTLVSNTTALTSTHATTFENFVNIMSSATSSAPHLRDITLVDYRSLCCANGIPYMRNSFIRRGWIYGNLNLNSVGLIDNCIFSNTTFGTSPQGLEVGFGSSSFLTTLYRDVLFLGCNGFKYIVPVRVVNVEVKFTRHENWDGFLGFHATIDQFGDVAKVVTKELVNRVYQTAINGDSLNEAIGITLDVTHVNDIGSGSVDIETTKTGGQSHALKLSNTTTGGQTSIVFEVPGPGLLAFQGLVNARTTHFGRVDVNGTMVMSQAGTTSASDFLPYNVGLPEAMNTVKMYFDRPLSTPLGDNSFYISDVQIFQGHPLELVYSWDSPYQRPGGADSLAMVKPDAILVKGYTLPIFQHSFRLEGTHIIRYYMQHNFSEALDRDVFGVYAFYYNEEGNPVRVRSQEYPEPRLGIDDWSQYVEIEVHPHEESWVHVYLEMYHHVEAGKTLWIDPSPTIT